MRYTDEQMNALDGARLWENIAAITSEVFRNPHYDEFYAEHGDRVGGTPGIWDLCVRAAAAFTDQEPADWEDHNARTGIDFLLATLRMGGALLDSDGDVHALARWAIHGQSAGKLPVMRCPTCGNTDRIEITVTMSARLVQGKDGTFETDLFEATDGDQEWDDDSPFMCVACGRNGNVIELYEKPTDGKDTA